ncbi:MAG: SDR family oxidoreductase [Bacteroidota bacterium]
MNGKVVLITGATDGIGRQTALELAQIGHHVIIHGRNKERVQQTLNEIQLTTNNHQLSALVCDLASLKAVRKLAEEIKSKFDRLDVLINNAGIYMKKYVLTEDGFETTFAVNHLAHFLLTNLLLDLIKKSDEGRIINVSSIAHTRANFDFENLNGKKYFDPYGAYSLSKLANLLFTKELSYRLPGTDVTVNALHPGVINTKLLKAGFNIEGASVKNGAETPVYLAVSDDVKNRSGAYFVDKQITRYSKIADDKNLTKKFWELSETMVGL